MDKILADENCPQVLYGQVVERDSWVGKADHPFKTHASFKARGVPTMMMFQDGQEMIRVDDQKDFENPDLMQMFLEQ